MPTLTVKRMTEPLSVHAGNRGAMAVLRYARNRLRRIDNLAGDDSNLRAVVRSKVTSDIARATGRFADRVYSPPTVEHLERVLGEWLGDG